MNTFQRSTFLGLDYIVVAEHSPIGSTVSIHWAKMTIFNLYKNKIKI